METPKSAERAAAGMPIEGMIVRDPRRCGGDPILAGTRTAVHAVISYLMHYEGNPERVRDEALPHLTLEQIQGARYHRALFPISHSLLSTAREGVAS